MGRQRRTSIIGIPPAGLVVPSTSRLWTPADIPELTGWWDADSGVSLDSANVTRWANKIGAGSFVRNSAGPQLSLYNGTPSLLFDGSGNQWMQLNGTPGVTPNSNLSVTLLCAAAPNRGSGGLITTVGGSFGPFVNSSGFAAITFSDKVINVASDAWVGTHRALSTEFFYSANPILRSVHKKSPYMDRSPYVFGRDTSNDPTYLGNDQNSRYFSGSLTAVAMAPVLLAGIDIDRWEGYYAHKTRSTDYLPATHPFKLAPPRI